MNRDNEAGVAIEWLILADSAQVVGNKLYLLGGGWDVLTAGRPFPLEHQMAVALSIAVPWHETNRKHAFEVEFATEDGAPLAKTAGEFEMGRPPGIKPGQSQRSQLAFGITLKLDKAGTYVVTGRLDSEEQARAHFNVVLAPGVMQKA